MRNGSVKTLSSMAGVVRMSVNNLPTADSIQTLNNNQLNFLKSLNLLLAREIEFIERFENHISDYFFNEGVVDFYEEVQRFEILMIRLALTKARGNQKVAARLLGMNPTTINAKIKRYEIEI